MKPLEDMTFAQRFGLTIVIVMVILFALALFGYFSGAWDDADAQQPMTLSAREKEFIAMDREAMASAYKEQLHHLFLIWARDNNDQPRRAVNGAKQARVMYEATSAAIDERERRLNAGGP